MYTEKSYSSGLVHFEVNPAVYWMMVNILILQPLLPPPPPHPPPVGFYQEVSPESSYIIVVYMIHERLQLW